MCEAFVKLHLEDTVIDYERYPIMIEEILG
jgi:hypothetical protein